MHWASTADIGDAGGSVRSSVIKISLSLPVGPGNGTLRSEGVDYANARLRHGLGLILLGSCPFTRSDDGLGNDPWPRDGYRNRIPADLR